MVSSALKTPQKRPQKKQAGQYHHGDLRRALIDQALQTIAKEGAEGFSLRHAGDALGVSRTALYRHFADKQALMAAVATEGFRTLRLGLVEAWERQGRGFPGLEAMGDAYVQFAIAHPSHYRVMFGRFVESGVRDPELIQEAAGAFQALVDALLDLQRGGLARPDDPLTQARFVWSVVHGVSMLAIDGQLGECQDNGAGLTRYAVERIQAAIRAS
jgi:AcrR family transcriptional regulator